MDRSNYNHSGLEVDRTSEGIQSKYSHTRHDTEYTSLDKTRLASATHDSRGVTPWKGPWGLRPLTFGLLIAMLTALIVGGVVGGGVGGSIASRRDESCSRYVERACSNNTMAHTTRPQVQT